MIFKAILLSVCIVLAGFSRYTSAAYGDTCSTTTACTALDNTECVQSSGCTNSACTGCKTGYTLTGGTCKADIGTACSGGGDCALSTNAECASSLCACTSGNTYSTTYKGCAATGKHFGATCAAGNTDADCAVDTAGKGDCISLQCDCAAGYIKGDGHVCRKPYYDEACTNGEGCISRNMLAEQAPVCPVGATKCECASTDEAVTYEGVSFCNTKVTAANKIANSLTCTTHNECSSGKCYKCPDTSGLICIGSTDDGSPATMVKPTIIVMVTLITGLLQL